MWMLKRMKVLLKNPFMVAPLLVIAGIAFASDRT